MKCTILHQSKGRIRVRLGISRLTLDEADLLEYYLKSIDGITDAKVYDRTADAVIFFTDKKACVSALSKFSFDKARELELVPEHTSRALNREFEDKLVMSIALRTFSKLLLPAPIAAAIAVIRSVGYIKKAILSLRSKKLTVEVLDATAVTVSLLRGSFKTAGSVMFMLKIGEILDEWTHKKSVADLAGAMSLGIDKVWTKVDGTEVLLPIKDIKSGDRIVVRTGGMIPLDGTVTDGTVSVNQSSVTGESLPVLKQQGSYVYAGTVVEDGECEITVDKATGNGHYDRIVSMIEQSEKLKSATEDKASRLADRLVPYTFAGTVLTYLLTRNPIKALSVLMVDFSCALKLSMPIAVLSAMREAGAYGISVKGGKFMEAVANADTIVFDKTGTLTHAAPTVAQVVTFGDSDEDEMLRLAACLEEHYPHSMANAVTKEAERRGLSHEEYHSSVQYVVAHGISSSINGNKVIIGSAHFVFEDEGCVVPDGEEEKFDCLKPEYSHLYLCISGVLKAVICISDPLRAEAKDAIDALHSLGIKKVVMMTGDNKQTADAVAKLVGVDEYHAEVLPEDKAEYIRLEHEQGRKVIMIGDGVNDSPALSEADAGIAINTGAAIAKEIADITVSSEDLYALVTLRRLSEALMDRIHSNYRFILSFNLMLIALGVTGIIQPTVSALLHNMSTLGIGLKSTTKLLGDNNGK